MASSSGCHASHGWELKSLSLNSRIEQFCLSGPVLGLVRICDRKEDQRRSVILDNSFLDTFKINLGISVSPVYDPDFKKLFILLVKWFLIQQICIEVVVHADFDKFEDFVVSVFLLRLPGEQHLQIKLGGSSHQPLLLQNSEFLRQIYMFESEKSGWHVRGACGIWWLWLGHC